MAIEKVRGLFGIRYVIPYNITSRKPYTILRAVGEISLENDIEKKDLLGGHVEAPHDTEYGQPIPALSGTVREYPAGLFQILETTTVTENAAETSGNVSTVTNGTGTSVINAGNGISNVTANPAQLSNLVFGRYVFVATAAQTVDIHLAANYGSFLDMTGQAVASVDCSSAGSVQVNALGIVLTVVGTSAFTTADTGYCDVRPVNTGSTEILVGAGTEPSNFGVMLIFPTKTDGVQHWIDIFNVSGRGMPFKGVSREFSEFDINWSPLARSSDGAVYQFTRLLTQ